jgi:hypothetical protein
MTLRRPKAIVAGASISILLLGLGLGLATNPSLPDVSLFSQGSSPEPSVGPARPAVARRGRAARRPRAPTTYYVSPDGRDSNRGTSTAHPWQTVTRVDRANLIPGDEVMFEGGATFSDATLMPGLGFDASGKAGEPIVFGSYGKGLATLTRGVWLGIDAAHPHGPSHLTFENLSLGPQQGFLGTGDYITLRGLTISHLVAPETRSQTGIATEGSHWVIADNDIFDTGDSGMLLGFNAGAAGDPAGGRDYLIYGNSVSHTGLDSQLSYGLHAIYLKVSNATISNNRLTYFRNDGISLRYRDTMVSHNYIAHGAIGIAWYQYDQLAGRTMLIANTIAYTTRAAIFVCGVAQACKRPLETFVMKRNRLREIAGTAMDLQPTAGQYLLQANQVLQGGQVLQANAGL